MSPLNVTIIGSTLRFDDLQRTSNKATLPFQTGAASNESEETRILHVVVEGTEQSIQIKTQDLARCLKLDRSKLKKIPTEESGQLESFVADAISRYNSRSDSQRTNLQSLTKLLTKQELSFISPDRGRKVFSKKEAQSIADSLRHLGNDGVPITVRYNDEGVVEVVTQDINPETQTMKVRSKKRKSAEPKGNDETKSLILWVSPEKNKLRYIDPDKSPQKWLGKGAFGTVSVQRLLGDERVERVVKTPHGGMMAGLDTRVALASETRLLQNVYGSDRSPLIGLPPYPKAEFSETVNRRGQTVLHASRMYNETFEGSLVDLINDPKKLTFEQRLFGCLQLAKGLDTLHDHQIVHNDITFENCLYKVEDGKSTFVISDLGVAYNTLKEFRFQEKPHIFHPEDQKILENLVQSPKFPREAVSSLKKSRDVYCLGKIFERILGPYLSQEKELQYIIEYMTKSHWKDRYESPFCVMMLTAAIRNSMPDSTSKYPELYNEDPLSFSQETGSPHTPDDSDCGSEFGSDVTGSDSEPEDIQDLREILLEAPLDTLEEAQAKRKKEASNKGNEAQPPEENYQGVEAETDPFKKDPMDP